MKLHYTKILLFFFLLNILAHNNNNKSYITTRDTPIYTSRMLSEGDTQSSIYDKDADMKSVKEIFDRQTSQRFQEYEERMKDKSQKRKEEHDKNIQKIIEKDKMDKSLAEKIEKGCLKCGCGFGGVAASVGLFGGLGTYGWKSAAIAKAVVAAKEAAEKIGAAKGAEEGVTVLIHKLKEAFPIENLFDRPFEEFITPKTYFNADLISGAVKQKYESLCLTDTTCGGNFKFAFYKTMQGGQGTLKVVEDAKIVVREAVDKAKEMTIGVTAAKTEEFKIAELGDVVAASTYAYSAIGYSVLALLIIVLVMIIIYLILRYRRKKKMKKKAQYTELLNQ
ncbi:rifin PIR protein,putative [Plasmodium sp. DRC-Itaito]|nr:rifin PIR protein,putative [Plasmodium sp. DRC-Itaito]